MLELNDVSVAFSGKQVFSNVCFKLGEGERLSVIGRNGSGKSTLAFLLSGVIPDFIPAAVSGMFSSSGSGIVLQNPGSQFFAMSVLDELGENGLALAKKLGLADLLDRNVFQLSEGEKQKVNLVANLSFDHSLLFLDEPLELLDPGECIRFRKIIEGVDDRSIVWFDKIDPLLSGSKNFFLGALQEAHFPGFVSRAGGEVVLEADFSTRVPVLEASFSVMRGEKIALIGSNGSGKTSLLKALAGIIPFEGRVSSKSGVSFAPQNPGHVFFKDTVAEEIFAMENAFRLGLSGLLSSSPSSLSKGQQKLLAVASLLPGKIGLLDEPTTWLDPFNRSLVYRFVSESPDAMVIATHDETLLSYCDRVFVVEGGVVKECSSMMASRFFQT